MARQSFNPGGKIARRIVFLFLVCSLVPTIIAGLVSFANVRKQLLTQSQKRLLHESRAFGMSVYERLLMAEVDLETTARRLSFDREEFLGGGDLSWLERRFTTITLSRPQGATLGVIGDPSSVPQLTPSQIEHLRSGRTVLTTEAEADPARVFVIVALDPTDPDVAVLVGEMKADYLWGIPDENNLDSETQYCVYGGSNLVLSCSLAYPLKLRAKHLSTSMQAHSGFFQWADLETTMLTSYRRMFLKAHFHEPSWVIALTRDKALALGTIAEFRRTFSLVTITTLCLVAFLSMRHIRRRLAPLDVLRQSTGRIADGDLETRIQVASGDEFESLAESFNRMAERLGAQFGDLRAARSEAEASSRAKTEFLANMSHEIRTPMTAILGYTDEILDSGDLSRIPPDRLAALNAIKRNGNHLLDLINDILDLSKMEAGALDIERVRFSPLQATAEACSLMRVHAAHKDLDLKLDYPTALPETIESDPTRLRQILLNLVGNAIKFTEEGSIQLVTRLIQTESDSKLQIEVIDSGIGIDAEQQRTLFQQFSQADSSTTRRYGGTGLGLNICKRLAGLMRGNIEVESEVGKGSTFRLTLPIGSLEGVALIDNISEAMKTLDPFQRARDQRPPTDLLGCQILLAEDGPDNQRLIRRILERAGAKVEVAGNGQVAIELALSAQSEGTPFQVILMDIQMPILDGYAATGALRRAGYDLPIIALTAHATSADRERCVAAGCDDFATKPIVREVLLAMISRYAEAKLSLPNILSQPG